MTELGHGRKFLYKLIKHVVGTWDPSEFPVEELVRAGMAMTEIGIRQPKLQVLGGSVIVDMEGLTLRHISTLTPTVAYQIVSLMGVNFISIFYRFHKYLQCLFYSQVRVHLL